MADVAREVGITVKTLDRWRADAVTGPARDRVWTAVARLEAVIATAALNEEKVTSARPTLRTTKR